MEINKVQWRMIAKGEKLPCDSFLMKKDGTMTSMVTGAGVTVGQDAYYLPVEELMSFPKEESEDERMIQYFKDLAPFDKAEELYEKYGFSHNDAIDWLEKQAEQKPDDKVEQKFKVGDYVVGKYISGYISEVRDDCYLLDYQGFPIDKQDNYHLWTIQDAKDGDVLCSGQIIVIFKHFEDPSYRQSIVAYIGLDAIGNVQITDDTWTLGIDKVKPATKEQRDTLLKAMTDAGYTFDFEKKELKKVEQKPTEEYNITGIKSKYAQGKLGEMIKNLKPINEVLKQKSAGCSAYSFEDMYEASQKCYNDKYNKEEYCHEQSFKWGFQEGAEWHEDHKQEWSEEDESHIKRIIEHLEGRKKDLKTQWVAELHNKEIDWLKSLRPQNRWKPSDEQMEALKYSTYCPNEQMSKVLFELYQDLKNL